MMNPEMVDPYASLRLSKQRQHEMFEEFAKHHMPYCHGSMNHDFAETGKSFRIKDNSIKLNSTRNSISLKKTKSRNQSTLEDILTPYEHRQSQQTKSLLKSINDHSDVLERSDHIVNNMVKLRQMKLLNNKQLPMAKYGGVIRAQHVYNDYHTKETNPGYSRNKLGGYYTS